MNRAVKKLVERGELLFNAPKMPVRFTSDVDADKLLNDLSGYPHAFVLACIMDRQVKAERAWAIPYRLSKRLGNFKFTTLAKLSLSDIKRLMSKPDPLHRFVDTMSVSMHAGIHRIADQYNGDASRIWADTPPSAEVVYRLLQFRGIGPKIATMAANILARDFKVRFSDHYSIDISADVHVKRVFGRLGLCAPEASVEQVVYRARSLYPQGNRFCCL
jgi:uncharacterized HhH-GPD family protein